MEKSADAYRTISEVAEELKLPQHVLRFWETRFPQVKPMKRGGNRRFYRPADVELLRAIKTLLYGDGFTIKGVQRIFKEQGPRAVASLAQTGHLGASGKLRTTRDQGPQDAGSAADDHDGPDPSIEAEMRRSSGVLEDASVDSSPGPEESTPDASSAQASAPSGTRAGIQEALRAVLFELSECERILAVARGQGPRGELAAPPA